MKNEKLSYESRLSYERILSSVQNNYYNRNYNEAYKNLKKACNISPMSAKVIVFASLLLSKFEKASNIHLDLEELIEDIFKNAPSSILYRKAINDLCQRDSDMIEKIFYKILKKLIELGEEEKILESIEIMLCKQKKPIIAKKTLDWYKINSKNFNNEKFYNLIKILNETKVSELSREEKNIEKLKIHEIVLLIKREEPIKVETLKKWLDRALKVGGRGLVIPIYKALKKADISTVDEFSEKMDQFFIKHRQDKN